MRVVRFVVLLLLAAVLVVPAAALAYAISIQPQLLDQSLYLTLAELPGMPDNTGLTTNGLTLCALCGGYGALLTAAVLLPLGAAARRGRARKHDRQLALLKSKLLERDEEVQLLRERLRGGGEPEAAPLFAPEPPAEPSESLEEA